MRESRVWAWVESHLPTGVYFDRIEVKFPSGMADCFWTDSRGEYAICGWLELKYCADRDPAYKAGRIPKIRPSQPLFLSRQARHGVPSGILLRAGDTWHFWRSNGSNEWNTMVQGAAAVANATYTWERTFPTIEEILHLFTSPL